ncbi:MAG: heavy metal translocating P-type ATPase [Archangium gephyra]|jgi:Cd2+/Zn2+-exporting ATPase|uniref:Heavy metal translocating P-type ATPase n=1 Tax=Archangium gephyra TaxID=48 RepID=A0A2W5SVU8_9BACT|nr:MAG: heavy metal translocating P-type ATPase [Archangium gephyra]
MSEAPIRFEVRVQHLDCEDEAAKIEAGLRGHHGVIEVRTFPKAGKVSLTFVPSKTSREALEGELASLGFPVARDADREAPGLWTPKVLTSIASGLLLAVGWVLTRALPSSWPSLVAFGLAILVGGYFFAREGIQKLIGKRVFGIEVLMSAAAIGAAALGEPLEAAMLVFLYSISEAAEGFTEQKTRAAVRALMKLVPKVALVRRDGVDMEIPIEGLGIGDVFIVRPGESVATDGEVLRGETSMNQAPVTGESAPVKKATGDEVFAGTINAEGVIEVRATKTFRENTVAKIIHLVEEAQEKKGESQRFIERFGARYSPAVLLGGILIAAVLVFAFDFSWSGALHRAVVFIVAAAPCALVISVPITLVAALGTGARHGVLIKGGVILERLATVRTVALDKTGTLTRGEPVVTDFVRLNSSPHAESETLSRLATIESRSEHPVARAIVAHARAHNIPLGEATAVRALPGAGVVATIDGVEVQVGRIALFEGSAENGAEVTAEVRRLEAAGKTVIVAGTSSSIWCVVAVQDAVREEASEAVRLLRARGVELIVLSGDQRIAVERVAATLGIKRFLGALKPEDKLVEIRTLAEKAPVAMVGDGVNDAPALAQATVGIAMGAVGTDVALETADVALMGDDLRRLAFALALAQRTQRVVRQNLALSILVIGTLAIGAVAGVFSLPVAVLVHEVSEFIVIGSGLRMLRVPATMGATA